MERTAFVKNVKLIETEVEEEELVLLKEHAKINTKFVVDPENVNYLPVNRTILILTTKKIFLLKP